MDQRHPARARKLRQTKGVEQRDNGIFRIDREFYQFTAGRLEVRLEATAGASDQSEPPGAADRLRHFKRSPLDTASIKFRGDL